MSKNTSIQSGYSGFWQGDSVDDPNLARDNAKQTVLPVGDFGLLRIEQFEVGCGEHIEHTTGGIVGSFRFTPGTRLLFRRRT